MDSVGRPSGGTILWLRRDLRIGDHPAWQMAIERGEPIWPVFILDPVVEEAYGAAPKWRLGKSLNSLATQLKSRGSRLILRRGDALRVLQSLINETGARRLIWSNLYDAESIERDQRISTALRDKGIAIYTVNASLLFEPWSVVNQSGQYYRVFTPFWKAVRDRPVLQPQDTPNDLLSPAFWPSSDTLNDWQLGAGMGRGIDTVDAFARAGEAAALTRLSTFTDSAIDRYNSDRDLTGLQATSKLSENLAYGEISPQQIWYACVRVIEQRGHHTQADSFMRQLVWREFAYHLLYHTPHIVDDNWRPAWNVFPWRDDNADAEVWRRGMTGIEMVDAAMREMYVTGTMHNRTRMLVASFLTKHLLTHWKVGEAWFRECLIDWDIASNAMGWQWTAGSGPDAAPYFRIYNPDTQAKKFDADRRYRDRFLAEGRMYPHQDALQYFDAVPRSWGLSADQDYPAPIIGLKEGRSRAMNAYNTFREQQGFEAR